MNKNVASLFQAKQSCTMAVKDYSTLGKSTIVALLYGYATGYYYDYDFDYCRLHYQ
jgi:hypothetical protein